MQTPREYSGGDEALHRLEERFSAGVLADPLLRSLFAEGRPEHVGRLTDFIADPAVGEARFSREHGLAYLIEVQRGLSITEEQRRRFVQLYLAALDESDLPDAPDLREALRATLPDAAPS